METNVATLKSYEHEGLERSEADCAQGSREISIDYANGEFSLVDGGGTLLKFHCEWESDGCRTSSRSRHLTARVSERGVTWSDGKVLVDLEVSVASARATLRMSLSNMSDDEVELKSLRPIVATFDDEAGLMLVGDTLERRQDRLEPVWIWTDDWERVSEKNVECEALQSYKQYLSPWNVLVYNKVTDKGCYAAIGEKPVSLPCFHVRWDKHQPMMDFELHGDTRIGSQGVLLEPGRVFAMESVFLNFFKGNPRKALMRGTSEMAEGIGVRKRFRKRMKGYCDWYWAYGDINEKNTLENIDFIAEHFDGTFDVFQIDDGWQISDRKPKDCRGGPWEASHKFPSGIPEYTRAVKKSSMKAGVWMRPFSLARESETGKAHSDWFVESEEEVERERGLASEGEWNNPDRLDITKNEVVEYIQSEVKKLVEDWGVDYLKLDFLARDFFRQTGWGKNLLVQSRHKYADRSRTNMQVFCNAMEAIRVAAGDETFILGCNTLMIPGAIFFDGMRTGNDIAAHDWDKTMREGVCPLVLRAHQHNRLFVADPDCLVVREELSLERAKIWAGMIALSGQLMMISENLPELGAERLALIETLVHLDIDPDKVEVLDLFENEMPMVILAAPNHLGIFNHGENAKPFRVDLRDTLKSRLPRRARDIWTGTEVEIVEGIMELMLEPETSFIFKLST